MKLHALIATIFLVASLLCQPLSAQQEPKTNDTNLAKAIKFLHGVYPELNNKKYTLSFVAHAPYDDSRDLPNSFELSIGKGPRFTRLSPHSYGPSVPLEDREGDYPTQFMTAGFRFDAQGHLAGFESFYANPTTSPFRQFLLSQPDEGAQVTDQQAQAELKREGAKFTIEDKERLMQHLPRQPLAELLGNFDVISANFGPGSTELSVIGFWNVTITVHFNDGTSKTYVMRFNEFDGKLESIQPTDKS